MLHNLVIMSSEPGLLNNNNFINVSVGHCPFFNNVFFVNVQLYYFSKKKKIRLEASVNIKLKTDIIFMSMAMI